MGLDSAMLTWKPSVLGHCHGIEHVPDLSRRGYGLRVPAWKTYNTRQAWRGEKEREGRRGRRWKILFIKEYIKKGKKYKSV